MCDQDADASVPDFWLGVMASTVGSIVLNLGINLQRLAHTKMAALPVEERRPYVRDPLWLFGFAIFILGNAGDAIGLTFTPQSVITPIGSVSLVSNLFFARCLIKEHIGLQTLASVVLIIGGVLAIVLSADSTCSVETVDTILTHWSQTPFIVFAALHVVAMLAVNVFVVLKERKMAASQSDKLSLLTPSERKQLRFAYPLVASMYATWTVLLVKTVGELLKETFRGENQFTRWEAYMFFLGAALSAPLQVYYLNSGLRLFESLFIVPAFYFAWVCGSVAVGASYWGEFDGFMDWQFGVFCTGIATSIAGVFLLSGRAIESSVGITSTTQATVEAAPVAKEDGVELPKVPRSR